ncbi:MAG TPA: hypothetical protein PKD77_09875 [Rudaea sp.]|jgi:hypothetical protein|nr:hypothetical protein [Rudaea sp.]
MGIHELSQNTSSWKEISLYGTPSFPDEIVLSCYLARIFAYYTDRNAWWGSRAGECKGFFCKRNEIERKIENERTRGTIYSINELPAICLIGKTHNLVFFDLEEKLFEKAQSAQIQENKMHSLSSAIKSAGTYGCQAYLAHRQVPSIALFPFKTYTSHPKGADQPLEWIEQNGYSHFKNIENILLLVSKICIHLNLHE